MVLSKIISFFKKIGYKNKTGQNSTTVNSIDEELLKRKLRQEKHGQEEKEKIVYEGECLLINSPNPSTERRLVRYGNKYWVAFLSIKFGAGDVEWITDSLSQFTNSELETIKDREDKNTPISSRSLREELRNLVDRMYILETRKYIQGMLSPRIEWQNKGWSFSDYENNYKDAQISYSIRVDGEEFLSQDATGLVDCLKAVKRILYIENEIITMGEDDFIGKCKGKEYPEKIGQILSESRKLNLTYESFPTGGAWNQVCCLSKITGEGISAIRTIYRQSSPWGGSSSLPKYESYGSNSVSEVEDIFKKYFSFLERRKKFNTQFSK